MDAKRPRSTALASLAALAALTSTATTTAQYVSGADRYLGAAQGSLGRANATIAPNYVTRSMGGSPMLGTTQQSFDRTNALMQSMLANREATIRGLGQHAVYRTSDNLYGVYWQNYYMRRAQMYSTYLGTMHGRPIFPVAQVYEMQMIDNARRRLQQDARGREIIRRMDLRSPELPPNPGLFPQEVILNEFTGADLIRRDAARAARELPPFPNQGPAPARPRPRGRSPRD